MVTPAGAVQREERIDVRPAQPTPGGLSDADRGALLSAADVGPAHVQAEAGRLTGGADAYSATRRGAMGQLASPDRAAAGAGVDGARLTQGETGDEPPRAEDAVYRPGEDDPELIQAQRRPRPRGTVGPRGRRYYPPLTNAQYFRIQRLENEISGLRRELRGLGGREPSFISSRPRGGYHNPRETIRGLEVQRDAYRRAIDQARRPPRGAPGASSPLGRSLEAAGYPRPAGAAAHHIVALNARAAAPARAVLRRYNININSASNGVWLPATRRSPNPNGAAVHSTLHTRRYYDRVNQALGRARSRSEALQVLQNLRGRLLSGGL